MPNSHLRDGRFAKLLRERFNAGSPSRVVFDARIASYYEMRPSSGRKNRTSQLASFKKNTGRWLKGRVPQPNMWPAIAKALEETEEFVEQLCTSPYALPVSSIYRFASPPIVVLAAWDLADGTLTPHQHDQQAFEMLQRDIKLAIGVDLDRPVLAREWHCPTSYMHRDLILISGPNNNPLAAKLNSCIAKSDLSAFYFAPMTDVPTPTDGWLITHTKIDLRIVLQRQQSRDNEEDYGIIYVGSNPESSEHHVIWLAGLHSRGTIGAGRALLAPEVRDHIQEEFKRGKQYVSAVVRFNCAKLPAQRSANVLYA